VPSERCSIEEQSIEYDRPLGRPRRRWENNIKMDLQEVGCGGMDCIELARDRQVAGTGEC
jgi:hypothetical protein